MKAYNRIFLSFGILFFAGNDINAKRWKLLMIFVLLYANAFTQNTFPSTGSAGIGTTTPNASSALEIKSTTQGILIPRMTKTKRNAIASPAEGLMIYQTNSSPGFYYYNGSAWVAVSGKNKGWSLTGNAGTDTAINFIGTSDAQPLLFKINNQKAGLLDSVNGMTSFGYKSLSGFSGSAFGFQALSGNTTGLYNTALGYKTLYTNTNGVLILLLEIKPCIPTLQDQAIRQQDMRLCYII